MTMTRTTGELDPAFSSEDATATPWSDVQSRLEDAETYWISTVRPDGRPHVTPLVAVWLDGAMYFCTGPTERKARNLEHNQQCLLTTGCNDFQGIDVVFEGVASRVTDETKLQRIADRYGDKYEPPFNFVVRDGAFATDGNDDRALVFEVTPTKIFAFEKGDAFGQTRWLPQGR